MEKQRFERQRARKNTEQFVLSLDIIDREQFEVDFVRETTISIEHREAFHDWIAEKQDLGNPYPALRAKRQKQALIDSVSLPS